MNDTRDLRDPQKLGNKLLSFRAPNWGYGDMSMSAIADATAQALVDSVPDYRHDELLSTETAAAYKAELEARAASGDKYAKSMLAGEGPIDDGE